MRGLGLGLGLSLRRNVTLTQVFSAVNGPLIAWSPTGTVPQISAQTNPEDGGLATDLKEDTSTGYHLFSNPIPFVSGKSYRIRLLVKALNETIFAFFTSVDGGSKYLYYDFTTGTNISSANFNNITRTSLGSGWYVVTADITVTAAGGTPDLAVAISKPGPTPSFTGVVTDGLTIGSVRIYEIGY